MVQKQVKINTNIYNVYRSTFLPWTADDQTMQSLCINHAVYLCKKYKLSLVEKVETKSNQKTYKQTSVTITEESYNFIKEHVKNYSYFATTCEAILLTVLKNKEVINNV